MISPEELIGKDAIALTLWLKQYLGIYECRYIVHLPKSDNVGAYEFSGDCEVIEKVHSEYTKKDPNYEVGFQSKVIKNGKTYHLPMLDFTSLGVSNIHDAKLFLKKIHESGFILNTGKCFHFYGTRLLSENEWESFMKMSSKYKEIGNKYPSHQLRRGEATLRQTKSALKPTKPTVVAFQK